MQLNNKPSKKDSGRIPILQTRFLLLSLFLAPGPVEARTAEAWSDTSQFSSGAYEAERGDLRLMWYNVENLFHPSDDSLPGDDEFTPEGVRAWTYKRYRQKLSCLARVIVAAGRWQPPDLVGLCEVESPQVLEDLVSHPILAPFAYSYLHSESQDHRGMDVACLFRPERIDLIDWEYLGPVEEEAFDRTRDLLFLSGVWSRKDSFDLVLVHFISRYRGSGLTANYRRRQAAMLAALLDSLGRRSPDRLLLAAGDFNDGRDGWSMEPLSGLQTLPSEEFPSYKYRGIWNGIDFFLVSGRHDLYRIRGGLFNHPGLLVADLSYGGQKPFRTYDGYRYSGGYSDHLPVFLDISRRSFFRAGSAWD